jgi:hypothetical protein
MMCIECEKEATYRCDDDDFPDDPVYSCDDHTCTYCEAL